MTDLSIDTTLSAFTFYRSPKLTNIHIYLYTDLKITLKNCLDNLSEQIKVCLDIDLFEWSTHFIIQIIVITKLVRVWLNNDELNNHGVNL